MKKKKQILLIVVLLFALVAVLIIGLNGLNKGKAENQESPANSEMSSEAYLDEEGYSMDVTDISYEEKDMGEMLEELKGNSSKATKKYNDAFIEVTAILNDRDIEAGWFDLRAEGDDEANLLFTCKTLDESVLDTVSKMKLGAKVKICGQVVHIDKDYGYDIVVATIE